MGQIFTNGCTSYYSYYNGGQLKWSNYRDNVSTDYTIDAENRISQITHQGTGVFVGLYYGYDKLDNVTSLLRDDTGAGGQSKQNYFYYDDLNRLTKVEYDKFGSPETVRYSYDVVGNRTQLYSSLQGTTAYTYAANSNQLTYRSQVPEDPDFANLTYEYDLDGNLKRRRNATTTNYDDFIYDAFASQLSQVKKYRNGGLAQTVEYFYDADGNRRKVVDSSGTKYVLYDGGAPLLELDENKNITAYYVYGAAGVIYKRDISSDSYEFHHKNALGSVIMLAGVTDAGTNIIARYEYDAFGSIRTQAGSSDNTHKFTGKEYDDDVKLYYYGARYYDAYIGRFISRDPAGDGINWYVYCANNPLNCIDPSGMRRLYAGERGVARAIFGSSINLSKVTVRGGIRGWYKARILLPLRQSLYGYLFLRKAARTIGNTIYISKGLSMAVMMHEMTHVWQWQTRGFGMVPGATWAGISSLWDDSVYSAVAANKFFSAGIEQQAETIETMTRRFLIKPIGQLSSNNITTFVSDFLPILWGIQGSDGPFWGMAPLNIESYLNNYPSKSRPFWQVLLGYLPYASGYVGHCGKKDPNCQMPPP